jgi:SAM-dependent methyltransferase
MNQDNPRGQPRNAPAAAPVNRPVSTTWQLASTAAGHYQAVLVPAILGPFAQALVEAIGVAEGEMVVDIGCGTGAAARAAARRTGPGGRVVGVDINDGMLEVAASLPAVEGAPIEWRQASADRLPLEDGSMSVVLCAQTLQFLPIRTPVVAQMRRVLAGGGRLGVSTWCRLPDNPYFQALIAAVTTHLGEEAACGLRAIATLGDPAELRILLEQAPWRDLEVTMLERELDLPPLDQFVPRHLGASPMAGMFADLAPAAQAALVGEVAAGMQAYRRDDGTIRVPFRSNMAIAVA